MSDTPTTPTPAPTSEADLAELERLAAAADIPYRIDDDTHIEGHSDGNVLAESEYGERGECYEAADAAYIVAACNAAPGLVAELRRLRGVEAECRNWRMWAAAESRGFHDRMEGKSDEDCPYPAPANVEDETSERAFWLIGWRGCDDAIRSAERDNLRRLLVLVWDKVLDGFDAGELGGAGTLTSVQVQEILAALEGKGL